jgi:hypothetical protein
MGLDAFHTAFADGVRWRVTADGVEIEGSGVERTAGEPATMSRIWDAYRAPIERTARARRVPCALIVATIATESAGRADAVREEPGYRDDDETPHRISVGLMQTLISTAREALQLSCDRRWLLEPANSIEAGTAYIARQARLTQLDPPLVAAAYNAGRIAEQRSSQNRWRLRQYPIGTGRHCDRFVRFYNDAIAVLGPAPAPAARPSTLAPPAPVITFAANADPAALTAHSKEVLTDILRRARIARALISSTVRSPAEQARVMYGNLERNGVEHQKRLYGRGGDRVIDAYAREKGAGASPDAILRAMAETIREVGPENVSRHSGDPRVLGVFDVAPSSLSDRVGFEHAVREERRVSKFLLPPADPGYHLEIPQPR